MYIQCNAQHRLFSAPETFTSEHMVKNTGAHKKMESIYGLAGFWSVTHGYNCTERRAGN